MSSHARQAVKLSDVIHGFLSGQGSSFIKGGELWDGMNWPKCFEPWIYGNGSVLKVQGFLERKASASSVAVPASIPLTIRPQDVEVTSQMCATAFKADSLPTKAVNVFRDPTVLHLCVLMFYGLNNCRDFTPTVWTAHIKHNIQIAFLLNPIKWNKFAFL